MPEDPRAPEVSPHRRPDRFADSLCCFRGSNCSERLRLLWELTTSCNLGCLHCHVRLERDHQWKEEEAIEVAGRLRRWGIDDVIISGGEPLLIRWIPRLIDRLHTESIAVDLCTNGTAIDDSTARSLARRLAEVSVSLDSDSPEYHDHVRRRPGAWQSAARGIELLVEHGLAVHVIAVVTSENLSRIGEITGVCSTLGTESVTFLGVLPPGPQADLLNVAAQDEIKQQLHRAREANPRILVNSKQLLLSAPINECPAGSSVLGIDAQGRLVPCILLRDAPCAVDLLQRPLPESLDDLAAERPQFCETCNYRGRCGVVCPIGPTKLTERTYPPASGSM